MIVRYRESSAGCGREAKRTRSFCIRHHHSFEGRIQAAANVITHLLRPEGGLDCVQPRRESVRESEVSSDFNSPKSARKLNRPAPGIMKAGMMPT